MNPNPEKCPSCGATVIGGRAGCQALFEEIGFLAASNPRFAAAHRLAVDAYCMQHVEEYGHSAKSYAAHLTCLCCGIEHHGNPEIYAALQRWLNGTVNLEKPAVLELSQRGSITLADVLAAGDSDAQLERLSDWAKDVWQAYAVQHPIAHVWVETALKTSTPPKRR